MRIRLALAILLFAGIATSVHAQTTQINLATQVRGNLGVAHLNSGTGASNTTFWRGDGTWATPSGGASGCTIPGGVNLLIYDATGTCFDVTKWQTNGTTTLTGLATAILDLSAAARLRLPQSTAPTTEGDAAFNTTTHLPVWGFNGASTATIPTTLANAAHKWLNSYDQTTGTLTQTQPSAADIGSLPGSSGQFLFNSSGAIGADSGCATDGAGNVTCPTVGTANFVNTIVSGVLRAVTTKDSAGNVLGVDLYPDPAITDHGDSGTTGNFYWALAQVPVAGGFINVHTGTYTFLTGISDSTHSNIALTCDGWDTILKQGASLSTTDLFYIGVPTSDTSGWVISHCAFTSPTSGSHDGLHFGAGSFNMRMVDNYLSGWDGSYGAIDYSQSYDGLISGNYVFAKTHGISLSGTAGQYGNRVVDNYVFNGNSACIYAEYPFDTIISNNHLINCGAAPEFSNVSGIQVLGSNASAGGLVITGNVIDNPYKYCIELNTNPSTIGSVKYSTIADNTCVGSTTDSIWLGTGEDFNSIANNITSLPIVTSGTHDQIISPAYTSTFPSGISDAALTASLPICTDASKVLSSTCTGLVTVADLVSGATTVNGQTCTLGSPCAVESATSGQVAISGGSGAALTGAADLTYATHTFSGISTTIVDLSPATGTAALKVPSTTTNTASAAGVIDYDTSNSNYHANSGADSLVGVVPTASVPSTGDLIDASVVSSKFLLHDSGVATANVVTAAANGTTKQICTVASSNKACTWIDFPDVKYIPAANCNNTTAGSGWGIGSGGTVTCRAGTNNLGGYVSITDTSTTFATFQIEIPEDWDTATNPYIRFQIASTDATNNHTIIPEINVACYKGDGSTTDDVAANGFHSLSTTTLNGSANRFWSGSNVQMNSTDMTGCVAGALMQVTVGRATDTATNAEFYGATVTFPRLLTVQGN